MSNDNVDAYIEKFATELLPPDDFMFPFPPYEIQRDFMGELYMALEKKKLAIFESPTGTGKSLSLICGAFSWLRDHEEREVRQLQAALKNIEEENLALANEEAAGGDWLSTQVKQVATNNIKFAIRKQLDAICKEEKRISEIRTRIRSKEENRKEYRKNKSLTALDEDSESGPIEDSELILEDDTNDENEEENDEGDDVEPPVKIIFCSRTHSQLAQFIGEIQRTTFNNSFRVVPMGSRQNCCVNKAVKNLKSLSLMNEKCLDMVKSTEKSKTKDESGKVTKKSKSSKSCPFLKNTQALKESIVSEVMDLEEIVKKGEALGGCPYYATRGATADSQVIVVPYNILLHKSTRESSQLKIKNSIIIVDEAHNLLETVSHIHSSEASGRQLSQALSQLVQYKSKYVKLFSSSNLLSINQVIFVLKSLIKFLDGKSSVSVAEKVKPDTTLYTVSEFILSAGIDNYNLFKIVEFCRKNKISHKIRCFAEKYPGLNITPKTAPPKKPGIKSFLQEIAQEKNKKKKGREEILETPKSDNETPPIEGQPLIPTLAFLECLTMSYKEGRIVVSKQATLGNSSVKYLLLDPASVMKEIVQEARSVILAGGTMKPFSEFRDRLFLACGADESRIVDFSCGHVIPKENILPLVVPVGPTGQTLEFTFQKRNDPALIGELGRLLVNVCNIVPAGVVCFFPSYDYENRIYQFLEDDGLLKRIASKKKIFREPKTSSQVDVVLKEYADSARRKPGGALMFSVVGGKLSEGLNFSDDLGRCVVVVGMPYPNLTSPELKEKLKFLNDTVGPHAGQEYYENCCMKAVNQCIGRAVRHKNDFATVLLLDRRYQATNHVQLLPKWISASLQIQNKFGPVLGLLGKFFRDRR
ncbi:HELICc2 [Nesidiocoris tenuis]|uniref:HELICc2 n=1 Tax=Nesidiocoris tenuis TaxID=355587 RepID=A0ABN7AK08_9HEMI|nr:HELICc2 [Nesidiocoris tenuis]